MNCAMYNEIRSEKAFSRKNAVDLPNAGVCFIIPSHYFEHKIKDGSAEQRERRYIPSKSPNLLEGSEWL